LSSWKNHNYTPNQIEDLINVVDPQNGKSALQYASEFGRFEVVKLLLEYGANPNIMNTKNQSTPLHSAAYYGHASVVELLVRAGASINAYNANKITPLHCGKSQRKLPRVEKALEKNQRS
jgi:ankyrin repeat protein